MGRTTRKIFALLDLPTGPGGVVEYRHFEERPDYYASAWSTARTTA